jgi:uncharacterized protein (TIGR01244 family)
MAPRQVTDTYFVSPQIEAGDVPALKEAGISLIICNRPDEEIPPALQSEAIGAAAAEAGIPFEVLPLTHQTMTPENVGRQKALIAEADGLVLAYCASGTRSTVVWALGMAGELSADEILKKAAAAGYDLAGLRGALG